MRLEKATQSIKESLKEAGIKEAVEVELSVVFHEKSGGEIEVECLHSRSRRADQVHKLSFTIPATQASPERPKRAKTPPPLPVEASRMSSPGGEYLRSRGDNTLPPPFLYRKGIGLMEYL